MGEVFLAHDERLDRRVAIKRMRGGGQVPSHRRRRFRREATIAAKLNHPTIVHIYDVVQTAHGDCIVMEYVEGENLRQRIESEPLTLSEVLIYAHQIALGMAEAHDQGIVHRDLKSENILLARAGQIKITDFGIAQLHGEEVAAEDGSLVGTYRSMSPEQALGRTVDHRSDLFSFGILLYELLTGVSPFDAETPFLTLQRIVHAAPGALAELAPTSPPALVALVNQLLNKVPRLRPRDFHEVADALAEIMGGRCSRPCGLSRFGRAHGRGGGRVPRRRRARATSPSEQRSPDAVAPGPEAGGSHRTASTIEAPPPGSGAAPPPGSGAAPPPGSGAAPPPGPGETPPSGPGAARQRARSPRSDPTPATAPPAQTGAGSQTSDEPRSEG